MGKASNNHCYLSREARQWLDGELLGDGCLQTYSYLSAWFAYTSKHSEYIQYVTSMLDEFGVKRSGKIHTPRAGYYYYASLCYVELFPIWMEWYMYGGKQVPKDLELSSVACRQWYIGDGCLCKSPAGTPYIYISTCGFPPVDVLWLVMKLNQLGFRASHQPARNTVIISTYSTKDFLNYIGECPVECYKYKWEY